VKDDSKWRDRAFVEAVRLLESDTSLSRAQAQEALMAEYERVQAPTPRERLHKAVENLLARHPKPPSNDSLTRQVIDFFKKA